MTIQLVVAVHFGDFTKIIPPLPNMHVCCDATCTDISLFLSFYMKYNISIYNRFDIPFFIKGEVTEKKIIGSKFLSDPNFHVDISLLESVKLLLYSV